MLTVNTGVCNAHLVAEKAAGDVDLLTSHNYNLLPRENLLGDDGGQSAQEMALAIYNNGAR